MQIRAKDLLRIVKIAIKINGSPMGVKSIHEALPEVLKNLPTGQLRRFLRDCVKMGTLTRASDGLYGCIS